MLEGLSTVTPLGRSFCERLYFIFCYFISYEYFEYGDLIVLILHSFLYIFFIIGLHDSLLE